jgi:sulfate adenylyltransferase subunit 1 (EFTu-like GTPase family)
LANGSGAALLIVDSFEGIQDQTKRHAYILGMLGLGRFVLEKEGRPVAGGIIL